MGNMTKTCTIRAVAIYTSLQPTICQFMKLHTKHQVTHILEFILHTIRVNTVHLRRGWIGNEFIIEPIKY